MEKEKIELTQSGIDTLKVELRNLIDVARPAVIEELVAARAQGDLSENADYDAARAKQAEVEGRIAQIENILANAVVFDPTASNTSSSKGLAVGLSTIVTIEDLSDDTVNEYKIVSTYEADAINNKISNECALGAAIMGHHKGDRITVKVAKPYDIIIKDVKLED